MLELAVDFLNLFMLCPEEELSPANTSNSRAIDSERRDDILTGSLTRYFLLLSLYFEDFPDLFDEDFLEILLTFTGDEVFTIKSLWIGEDLLIA